MTMIEIMVVLGILGAILAFGVPRMNFKTDNVKTVARKLAVVTREVRNQARLKNRTYRLVFKLPEKEDEPGTYWVESADGPHMAPSEKTLELEKSLADGEKKPSKFQKDEKLLKKDVALPRGLFFGSIETLRFEDPITTGDAAIYFTPDGLVEKSAIQITNRKNMTWTLIINPLTGHSDVVEKAMLLKDATRE